MLLATITVAHDKKDVHADDGHFQKIVLSNFFYAEGADFGDFNKDGVVDVVYGPHWYAGPTFETKTELYAPKTFLPIKYSDNFITLVEDLNHDGYDDVIVNEWPGKGVVWFENPKEAAGHWVKHLAHPEADNESIQFEDVTGDGKSELIFHTDGRLGYATPAEDATKQWVFTPISAPEKWGQYTHGLGVGDVNGDGRSDFLMANGWWEQPASSEAGVVWKKHPQSFGKGGAQMFAYDVDGDGDQDVITSLEAHGYGLAWFEHVKKDGTITFVEHVIMGAKAEENPRGVRFSQIHALCLVDMDGDGIKDIITGKRHWAHGSKGDVEPSAPAVVYWFQLVRGESGVTWVPHQIDDDSGVGTQFAVGDLNGDKRPDVVTGNKKGGFVFIQEGKK